MCGRAPSVSLHSPSVVREEEELSRLGVGGELEVVMPATHRAHVLLSIDAPRLAQCLEDLSSGVMYTSGKRIWWMSSAVQNAALTRWPVECVPSIDSVLGGLFVEIEIEICTRLNRPWAHSP